MSVQYVLRVRWLYACRLSTLALLGMLGVAAHAQALRDPTTPPATEGSPASTSAVNAVNTPALATGGMAVLVRQGQPYLVVGTRIYAKGQTVGQARIERISETDVWFREAGVLRKVPVFGGIERHASKPPSGVSSSPTRGLPKSTRSPRSSPAVAQPKP